MKDKLVTRLLIDNTEKVYGVEVNNRGRYKKMRCEKEVVLSAGAIGSPRLTLLPGTKPEDHLKEMSIPSVENPKVGYDMQNHILVMGIFIKPDITNKPVIKTNITYNYLTKRMELGNAGFSSMIFTDTLKGGIDYPDIQYFMLVSPQSDPN